MTIEELNTIDRNIAFDELFKCCGCTIWAQNLIDFRPYKNKEELLRLSDMIWTSCENEELLEAFSHHPKIGDLKSLEKKFGSTKEWASGEQAGVNVATIKVLEELAQANEAYENKFGYIFIVCATGKTADEMLDLLKIRLLNDDEKELRIAKEEQNKITHIRLEKLLAS
ncbi:MAG: 2-oxo-4-hydroxy-4-carboxy-5-ureidoimidazoline decarboxylase [Bacteroidia bacterium]